MNEDNHEWRLRWAEYFEARARKSRLNAERIPQHAKSWIDKALTEEECSIILKMDRSLEQLHADLEKLS